MCAYPRVIQIVVCWYDNTFRVSVTMSDISGILMKSTQSELIVWYNYSFSEFMPNPVLDLPMNHS